MGSEHLIPSSGAPLERGWTRNLVTETHPRPSRRRDVALQRVRGNTSTRSDYAATQRGSERDSGGTRKRVAFRCVDPGVVASCHARAAVSGGQRISTFDRVGSIGRCVVERLSELEKWRIAELAAQGLPSRVIGKEIGRAHRTVWGYIRVLRRPPVPERKRSALRLSLTEREEISRGLAGGESRRSIARRLGRSPSTISREVSVNGGVRRYRACRADTDALRRARRPKPSKLASCARLRAVVEAKLELRWSPAQISGWLVEEFPDDPEMRVSHETIYLSLFVQSAARYVRN